MAVEVEEEQLATLQAAMKLLTELNQNPATRRQFEKAVKIIRPEVQTTDDIADAYAAPIREEFKQYTAKIDEFLTAQQEAAAARETADADRKRDEAFERLKAQGYTAETGIPAIQRLMVDRNIADPEAAAALFDKLNPPQEQYTGGSWEPNHYDFKNDAVERDVAGLFADPDAWADREVYNVLKEMRSQNA